MSDLGRNVKYGLGKESTAGTAVTATNWVPHLKFELNPMSNYVNNESAFGVIERTNGADVNQKWAEGTLEAKLTDKTSGLILLGAFGSVSTGANADGSGTVKNHTFTINQNIDGQSFTLVRKDSISTKAFALGRFGEWNLSVDLDDYVKFTAKVMALQGAATTATPAYVTENEFLAKHVSVKTAANVAGLAAATNESAVESISLGVNPNLESDRGTGAVAPYGFSSRGYELSFEMTRRYVDDDYQDAYRNGTPVAFELSIENTDVTIGTAEHPGFVFTAAKANITDWTRNEDLDGPITETMTGTIHYDTTAAYSLKCVATNLQTSY